MEEAKKEADFAIEKGAKLDPYNESPWRYLIGVLTEQQRKLGKDDCQSLLEEYEKKAVTLRDVVIEANRNPDSCANLTAARIDLLEMIGGTTNLEQVQFPIVLLPMKTLAGVVCDLFCSHDCVIIILSKISLQAISLAEGLANEHDPIRKKYWMLRGDKMKQKV